MTNPKAGHTSATGLGSSAEGLRDGDSLSSPSLTNPYEAAHGNGILRIADGAVGTSSRNSIATLTPGFVETASGGVVTIHGGWCVLDGALYKFAGGPGATQAITIGDTGTANFNSELPAVPALTSDVYVVVYIAADSGPTGRIRYEMGTPAAPNTGTPLIPSVFLSDPMLNLTRNNHQHTVLAVLRYTMTGGAANVTVSLNATPVLHDRRVFVRTSPMYLQHMTKGGSTIGTGFADLANAIDSHGDLSGLYPAPENGDFSDNFFGAIWQSHTPDKHSMLYYAAAQNLDAGAGPLTTHTHRLGPDELKVVTTTGNLTFTFDGPNIWIVTTDAARTINPTGTFPPGHTVEVYHPTGAHTLHFDSGGINVDVAVTNYGKFVYDGTNWHKLDLHVVS